jgi:putative hydrolase of the HAD superfamily
MAFESEKIKAIIFDWGGVFCTPAEPFALSALQQTVGKNVDEIANVVRELYDDYYRGKYTKETFWSLVLPRLGLKEDTAINVESLNAAYVSSYQLFPEMLDIAKKLSANYSVSLLSNLTPDMRDNIRAKHNVQDYFSPDTYSCDPDVGVLKPDHMIYEIALKKIAMMPEQCLFIDDSRKNIEAANALGMQTILFQSPEQFLQEISSLL